MQGTHTHTLFLAAAVVVLIIPSQCRLSMSKNYGDKCDKRKGLSSDELVPKTKLPKNVGQQLLMKATATKSSLAHALFVLHTNGLLNLPGDHAEREFNDALIDAGSELALSAKTP